LSLFLSALLADPDKVKLCWIAYRDGHSAQPAFKCLQADNYLNCSNMAGSIDLLAPVSASTSGHQHSILGD
jgi:hypothetical protein